MNVALPDTGAAYWTTPFKAEPGLRIRVDGTYPDARYMSLNVYDDDFGSFTRNKVSSALADYRIAPRPGSRNPWRVDVASGGAWRVTLTRRVAPGRRNVLPLLPRDESAGTLPAGYGFLIFRVYLPEDGDFDAVDLPTVTLLHADGSRTALSSCRTAPSVKRLRSAGLRDHAWLRTPGGIARKARATGAFRGLRAADPAELDFARPKASTTNTLFPNGDNAYLAAKVTPQAGQVTVVRGLAPRSPTTVGDGTSPTPWPRARWQLRYWSLCSNVWTVPYPVVVDRTRSGKVYGCAADVDTALDDEGRYTYVLSRPADRPANATAAEDVTWLPFSSKARYRDDEHALVLRNMLPNRRFDEAIQNVPQNDDASDAAAVMGDYYPEAGTCSVATFRTGGADACLAASGAGS
jgi:hypothetical protein